MPPKTCLLEQRAGSVPECLASVCLLHAHALTTLVREHTHMDHVAWRMPNLLQNLTKQSVRELTELLGVQDYGPRCAAVHLVRASCRRTDERKGRLCLLGSCSSYALVHSHASQPCVWQTRRSRSYCASVCWPTYSCSIGSQTCSARQLACFLLGAWVGMVVWTAAKRHQPAQVTEDASPRMRVCAPAHSIMRLRRRCGLEPQAKRPRPFVTHTSRRATAVSAAAPPAPLVSTSTRQMTHAAPLAKFHKASEPVGWRVCRGKEGRQQLNSDATLCTPLFALLPLLRSPDAKQGTSAGDATFNPASARRLP